MDHQELKAKMASPMPSREASVHCSEVSFNGNVQDSEHIDLRQEQVREAVRNSLQNHDRMDLGTRYCLLITIHKATHQECRALLKPMWNFASIAEMMGDDLTVMESGFGSHYSHLMYGSMICR